MKLDWNDEKSIRAWLQDGSTAMRGFAEMMTSLADEVDAAMPPAEAAPAPPLPTGGPRTLSPEGLTKPDWKDRKSVRAWLEGEIKVLRVTAEMMSSLASMEEAAMPPAESAPGAPAPTGEPGPRTYSPERPVKLIWNDEKSVQAWLQSLSVALDGIASMAKSVADVVSSAMPQAGAAPEAPPSTIGGQDDGKDKPSGS